MAGLPGRRGAHLRALRLRAPVRRERPGLQPARALAGDRHPRGRPALPPRVPQSVALVRARLPALLGGRPLHVQLPAAVPPRGAVPLDRGRGVPGRLPGAHGRPADPRPPAQPGARPRRPDRLADHHARARADLVGRADPADAARRRARDRRKAGLDRLSRRRHPAARGGDQTRRRHGRAPSGVLPAGPEHRRPARDRLRLRPRHPRGRVRRPGVARRRLDQLLLAVGRRGAPPLDGRARAGRARSRRAPHPAAAGAAGLRLAHRAGDGVAAGHRQCGRPAGGQRRPRSSSSASS